MNKLNIRTLLSPPEGTHRVNKVGRVAAAFFALAIIPLAIFLAITTKSISQEAKGTSESDSLQNVLNSMKNGGVLKLESGRLYRITSRIVIPGRNIIIEGNGAALENENPDDVIFEINQGKVEPPSFCLIEDAVFTTSKSVKKPGDASGAILISRSFGTTIRECSFQFLKGGFAVCAQQSENLRVESSRFDWSSVDVYIEALQSPHDSPFFCNVLNVQNCRLQHCAGIDGKGGTGIIASGNNISIRDCLVNVCANGGILLGRDLMTYGVDIDNVYFETNSVFDIRCASQYGVRYFRFSDITVRNGVARNDGMGGISRNVGYSVDLDGAKNGEITNYALLFGDPMEASISPDTSGREIKIRDSKLEKSK